MQSRKEPGKIWTDATAAVSIKYLSHFTDSFTIVACLLKYSQLLKKMKVIREVHNSLKVKHKNYK